MAMDAGGDDTQLPPVPGDLPPDQPPAPGPTACLGVTPMPLPSEFDYVNNVAVWHWDTSDPATGGNCNGHWGSRPRDTSPVPANVMTAAQATAGGGGGGGGGGAAAAGGPPYSGNWPSYGYGAFDVGDPFTFKDFAYDPFTGPTLEQAQNEPGYAFARDEGLGALQTSQAAKGIVRTGGSLKDLIGWGNKFATQNYGNVWNRQAQAYGINRDNAFGNWKGNLDKDFNAFNANFDHRLAGYNTNRTTYTTGFDYAYRAAQSQFDDAWRRWQLGVQTQAQYDLAPPPV